MVVREEMRIAALARAVIDGGARAEDVPRASREVLRLAGPSLPLSGLAGRALRELPHAGAEIHGNRRAPRSRDPHPPARSHGEDRNAECVLGVPRRPDARVGRRCDRALVRPRPAPRGALRRGAGGGTRGPARGRGEPPEPGPGFLRARDRARHGAGTSSGATGPRAFRLASQSCRTLTPPCGPLLWQTTTATLP